MLEQEYPQQKDYLLVNVCLLVGLHKMDYPVLVRKFVDGLLISLENSIDNRINFDPCLRLDHVVVFIEWDDAV